MSDGPPEEATALFREAPERFVAARDALVARLREEGRADEASVVKALRKPIAVVWALNQLSEKDPSGVQELRSAGAELRAAQQATLSSSGSGADRLRSASAARRAAASRLAGVAGDLLEGAGRGGRTEEIASALEAASVDDSAGERLTAGMLERLPKPVSGFGGVQGLTAVPGGADDRDDAPGAASEKRRSARSAGTSATERAEAEGEVAHLRRDREAAARRAKTAREATARLASRLEGMRERLAAAEGDHAEAEARARGADFELSRVDRELAKATKRLDARSRRR